MKPCKSCGAMVRWTKEGKRWYCYNPDGSDHWDLCSKNRWKQVVMTGERFETPTESGYSSVKHGTKFDHLCKTPPIRGNGYKLDSCTCGLPPWELCRPTCEHAL